MPDSTIVCPQCSADVRLPDALLGTPVKCPRCYHMFRAPRRDAGGALTPPELLPADVNEDTSEDDRKRARFRVQLPAAILLAAAMLALTFDVLTEMAIANNPAEFRAAMKKVVLEAAEQQNRPDIAAQADQVVEAMIFLIHSSFVAASLTVLGCLSALAFRFYPLAILGSLAAMVHLWAYGCLGGAPLGIWLLLTLLQRSSREQFARRSQPHSDGYNGVDR